MNRRQFLAASSAGAATAGFGPAASPLSETPQTTFRMKFAPHFGMFKNHAKGEIDQLQFMHDQGFRALEDNWMKRRPVEMQKNIAKEMARLEIEMGVFVAIADFGGVTFGKRSRPVTERIVAEMKKVVEVAKRVNAKWCTVIPGKWDQKVERGFQTAYAVEHLKRAAEVCEPSGLVMVLEPLNPWRDHAGLLLSKIPHAYEICKAVGSPSVKILDDLYHQQITEGNLIPNMDTAWDEIAYFQIGDNPGRNEPTTGEINYKNVFKHIHQKGYKGILGMEHGNSRPGKAGELALIKAYQECDAF
jgi:hydroxypyruvate isomerase